MKAIRGDTLLSYLRDSRFPVGVESKLSDAKAVDADEPMLRELIESDSVIGFVGRKNRIVRWKLTKTLSELAITLKKVRLPSAECNITCVRQKLSEVYAAFGFISERVEGWSPESRATTS